MKRTKILSWNTLGANVANWTSDANGSVDSTHKPLASETVIFSAGGAPSNGGIVTTLDAPFIVDSIQFSNTPGATDYVINPGSGGTLDLHPVSASGGIRVLAGGGNANIAAPLTVSAAQTWDVDPSGSLTISGNTAFNAAVSKTSAGLLTISGNNSGTGSITLTGGQIDIESNTALGRGCVLNISAGRSSTHLSGATLTNNKRSELEWRLHL